MKEGEEAEPFDDVPRAEVPNTLGAKASGESVDFVELQEMLANAMYQINDQCLKWHSYQIAAIVDQIAPAYQKNRVTPAIQKEMVGLSDMPKGISDRPSNSDFEHVTDLCETLDAVTSSIRRDLKNPDAQNVDLLKAISDAIVVGFNPERTSVEFAAEMTRMVREKYNKHHEEERAAGGVGD